MMKGKVLKPPLALEFCLLRSGSSSITFSISERVAICGDTRGREVKWCGWWRLQRSGSHISYELWPTSVKWLHLFHTRVTSHINIFALINYFTNVPISDNAINTFSHCLYSCFRMTLLLCSADLLYLSLCFPTFLQTEKKCSQLFIYFNQSIDELILKVKEAIIHTKPFDL